MSVWKCLVEVVILWSQDKRHLVILLSFKDRHKFWFKLVGTLLPDFAVYVRCWTGSDALETVSCGVTVLETTVTFIVRFSWTVCSVLSDVITMLMARVTSHSGKCLFDRTPEDRRNVLRSRTVNRNTSDVTLAPCDVTTSSVVTRKLDVIREVDDVSVMPVIIITTCQVRWFTALVKY